MTSDTDFKFSDSRLKVKFIFILLQYDVILQVEIISYRSNDT